MEGTTAPGSGRHPLADALLDAATGRPPAVDGRVVAVPPWRAATSAVVAFTGHALVAADLAGAGLDLAALEALGADAFGGAHHPAVLLALAAGGEIGCLDAVLVGRGRGGGSPLVDRPDLAEHPRAVHALHVRDDVRVLGDPVGGPRRGLATLARGLGGLTELSIELDAPGRGQGAGLLADLLGLVPYGDPVLACVAPGNVASLRFFLRSGFSPVASVQVVHPPA